MYEFINQLLNGVSLGAIYALIAVGYTMVYGIIKLINFAHGEFLMVGAFIGYYALTRLADSAFPPVAGFLLVLIVAGVIVGVLAVIVDILAYRPVRKAGRIAALLTAIGASLFLQNLTMQVIGAEQRGYGQPFAKRRFPAPRRVPVRELDEAMLSRYRVSIPPSALSGQPQGHLMIAADDEPGRVLAELRQQGVEEVLLASRIAIDNYQLIVLMTLALSGLSLYLLVSHTQMGRAMRAVSFDREAASLMGINANRVISFTFFVGAFFAGVCGVLIGMTYNTVDPQMGVMPGLKAFVAAVLGGIGRIPGAILGGFLMGMTEALVVAYGSSSYRDAVAFGILILVLLLRPQGLLGRTEEEKV